MFQLCDVIGQKMREEECGQSYVIGGGVNVEGAVVNEIIANCSVAKVKIQSTKWSETN